MTWPVLTGVTVAMGFVLVPALHGVGDSSWRLAAILGFDWSDLIFSINEGVGGRSTSNEEVSRLRDGIDSASSQFDQSWEYKC